MPIVVRCQSCSARLNVPDASAGKRVACPKCAAVIAVPAAEAAFEVVDDEPTKPTRTGSRAAGAKPVAEQTAPVEDDPDEDDPDEDDRPSRKRRRDGGDDRPRKKKSAKKGGPPVALLVAGGVGLVAVLGVIAYFAAGGKVTGPGGVLGPSTPAGYSVVGESAIGVKLFLPGDARGGYVRVGHRDGPPDPNDYSARGTSGDPVGHMTARRRPGFKPAASPEQLSATYEKTPFVDRPNKFEVLGKKPVTLGGKPGLEFRVKELPDLWDDTPHKAEFFKDKNAEEKRRVERDGKYYAILVAVNDEWTYVISIERVGKAVDDETVKTVSESIRFN